MDAAPTLKCPNCNDVNWKPETYQIGTVFLCLTCERIHKQRIQFTKEYLMGFWDGYNKGYAVSAAVMG